MSEMIRVETTIEADCLDGVFFGKAPGAATRVSEPMERPKAERLCGIPGFTLCQRSDADLAAIDAAIAAARTVDAGHAGGNSQLVTELQTGAEAQANANRAMSQELGAARQRVTELEKQLTAVGGGDSAAQILDLQGRITAADAEVARLREANGTLEGQNTTLRETNAKLGQGEDDPAVVALRSENVSLKQQVTDLEAQLTDPDTNGKAKTGKGK